MPNDGGGDRTPCFLVGAERSGTTMLRLMLDHHPEIAFHGEYEFVVDYLPETGLPTAQAFAESVRTDRVFHHWKLEIDPSLDYQDLMWSLMRQGRGARPCSVLGATVHRGFDRLPRIWPKARYIHMVRDPRDVAQSVVQMGWAGNVWAGASIWQEAEETWSRLVEQLAADQWIEIKFEQLVGSPEARLREICAWMDLDYSESMLRYSDDSTYSPPDAGIACKWKRKYPQGGAALVDIRVGPFLEQRGYELSGPLQASPGPIARFRLRVDDRLGRLRHAMRRYGAKLVLADLLARKLHIAPWIDRCRAARWAIDEAHLK